uniref:glutathione transferase n=1 Tax=Caenorhabditis tropicalis TaxID=1561998 RepID=A0A1I7TXV9_9PELO
MSIPQLHYFDLRGFGEYIRLLFIDNNIEFDDVRYKIGGKEWKEAKPKMIFGHMPCLKVDGKEYVETGAIMRHLGRKYGLNGSNEDDSTFLDMFFEGSRDIRYTYSFERTNDDYLTKTLPDGLQKLENQFCVHSGDFIIGERISYADYSLFEELDVYYHLDSHILDNYPNLKSFWERMWQRSNLKDYLKKRADDKVSLSATVKPE